jgi:hypothetical protein
MLIHRQNLYAPHGKRHISNHEPQSSGSSPHSKNIPCTTLVNATVARLSAVDEYAMEQADYGFITESKFPHSFYSSVWYYAGK